MFTAAVLTAFSLSGCGMVNQAFPADTYTVEKQDLKKSINVSGTVSGCDLVKITSTVSERIQTLNVGLGDYVKKGDVLCTFDDTSIREAYESAKKDYERAEEMTQKEHDVNVRNLNDAKKDKQESVEKAKKALDDAQEAKNKAYSDYDDLCNRFTETANRRDSLYNSMIVNEGTDKEASYRAQFEAADAEARQVENALNTLYSQLGSYNTAITEARDAYNRTVKSCDAAIQQCQDAIDNEKFKSNDASKKELDKIKERLDSCVITAPMDGIITAINVAEGNIPSTDAIMTIEDDSALKISATVREADILKISSGMKAVVKTSATKDQEFTGEVTKVVNIFSSDNSNPYQQSEGGYTVEITVKNSENVFIGMNAKVEIIIDEKDDVIAVPFDAITTDDDDNSVIYIAKETSDGVYKAEPVIVTTKMETDYFIEIESADVSEGDLIVLTEEYMNKNAEFTVRTGGLSDDEE